MAEERRQDYPKILETLEDLKEITTIIKTRQETKTLPDIEHIRKQLEGNGNPGLIKIVEKHENIINQIIEFVKEVKEDRITTNKLRWTLGISVFIALIESGFALFRK